MYQIFVYLLFLSALYIEKVYFATLSMPDFTDLSSKILRLKKVIIVGGNVLATVCTYIITISEISTELAGQYVESKILFGIDCEKVFLNFLRI